MRGCWSEVKSILRAPDVPRDLDPDAINHYLSFLYTPREGSIFRHIRKLPPGHVLLWHEGTTDVRSYWEVPAEEAFAGTEQDAVVALRDVLRDAVRSHLISDVPLGAFLSVS